MTSPKGGATLRPRFGNQVPGLPIFARDPVAFPLLAGIR